ncbi:glutamate-cysteine ligase family protein [Leucothrix arctica]|uniref:Glutamate--cysteine ligase n=1 Tax=Leucothrix arctica TaxID=1481894 RepID=A0A317C971_9GAMM|nr:glutamate-cysteine ligase family protein [Leucothrix arctica]PWQ95154.1 glutamate--cysteine ligase [Leucothrix arctica]
MKFQFGIEHETAFINPNGDFADFSNTPFEDFENIIETLPLYESDYPQLRIGDSGIKLKRWYIEGYERFNDQEEVTACSPKGIEIRTTIHSSVESTIQELEESYELLKTAADKVGYKPALVSFNPFKNKFDPVPPLSDFEEKRRQSSPEMITADIPMLTQGPDLSLSCADLSEPQIITAAKKLTYYSPFIVPFSFSSPFYEGTAWQGLSARTWQRTGARPAVMAFLKDDTYSIESTPSLTQIARVPAEVGRIEFKAFDSCGEFTLYQSLLYLLKGIVLDTQLTGATTTPDEAMHKRSAIDGFSDPLIKEHALIATQAAQLALPESERHHLDCLLEKLETNDSEASLMKHAYQHQKMSIEQIIMQAAR